MSTTNTLAIFAEPNTSTLTPKVYREDLVDGMFDAGLKYLAIIPTLDFVSMTNGYTSRHVNIRHYMIGVAIAAYAEEHDLVYENHLGTSNCDLERTGFLLASKTSPTTYIHVEPGEDMKRFLRCFELKAGLVLRHSEESRFMLIFSQYDKYRSPVVQISGELLYSDCFEYVSSDVFKDIQSNHLNNLERSLTECSSIIKEASELTNPFKDYLSDYIYSLNRMEQLFSGLKSIKKNSSYSEEYLDIVQLDKLIKTSQELRQLIPGTIKHVEDLLQQRADIEASLNYQISRFYKANSFAVWFVIIVLLVVAISFGRYIL